MPFSNPNHHVRLLCNLGMFCVALGAGVLPVYLTSFSESFGGLGPERLGQLPALLFAGFVAGILVSGPLADRIGTRIFAVAGGALCATGLLLAASAPTFHILLTAASTIGFGAGILDMLMSPIVAAAVPHRRSAALNQLHAFYSVGVMSTVLLASLALALQLPWRPVVAAMALLPAGVALGFLWVPLPPLVHPEHDRHGLRRLLWQPRFLLALAMILLVGAVEEGMSQWLPAYAETVLGYSKSNAAIALALYAVAQASGRFLGSSRWVRRIEPAWLLVGGATASTGCYLIAALSSLPVAALAGCVLAGFACSMLWPTHLGITADRVPNGGASMFGILAAAGNMGCVLAPWGEGIIAGQYDLRMALAIGALAPIALGVLALTARSWDRRAAHLTHSASG